MSGILSLINEGLSVIDQVFGNVIVGGFFVLIDFLYYQFLVPALTAIGLPETTMMANLLGNINLLAKLTMWNIKSLQL